jgi:hypothetical protein
MDDAQFEAQLTAAFQAPAAGGLHHDMTETILQRSRKSSFARASVLAGSGFAGVGIAVAALVTTELARPLAGWGLGMLRTLTQESYPTDASPFVAVGLTLMALTLARNAIRDL